MANFKDMSLIELAQYRDVINSVSERYAKELTTYARTSGDMNFKSMTPREQVLAEKRMKLVGFLNKIDNIIENKIFEECKD